MTWVPPPITNVDSFILLADNLKVVQQVETLANVSGGFWTSPSYARGDDPMAEYTIKAVSFEYVLDTTPANVKVFTDPDGTSNFTLFKQIDLDIHQIGASNLASVYPRVTGKDPRVKLELNPLSIGVTFAIRSLSIEVIERPRL